MPDSRLGQIHHIAYVVDDLESAAKRLHEQFGAGPFLYLDEVPVEDVSSGGEPAEFLHASAFGMCNEIPVELMVIAKMSPDRAATRFAAESTPRLQHVAYAVPPAERDAIQAELEAAGMPEYLRARFGEDVVFTYHDASASLGHDIELHADSEGLRGFFAAIEGAAENWDGTDLMRLPDLG
ncbi:MAG TPA: VOC family protein [Solirubrobacterales bacterium]|nr:VOC family protein [Solirubrobacterales bacterium]